MAMLLALWRKWFKTISHASFFVLRVFFDFTGFVYLKLFSLFSKLKNNRFFRKFLNIKKYLYIYLALVILVASVVVFFATSAKAEKEVHAYIMPSYITGEGVE